MRKTYKKLLGREVKRTMARFVSILAIVALGTGFLAGLTATTPDMQLTVDKYYDDNQVYDFNLKSNLGFSEDDVAAVSSLDGVNAVMPSYVYDFTMRANGSDYVVRVIGADLAKDGSDTRLNKTPLQSGRLPNKQGECVVVLLNEYVYNKDMTDTVFSVSKDDKNFDSLSDILAVNEFVCVGMVRSPMYFSIESEPSAAGTGSLNFIIYVDSGNFALDAYTDVFLKANGAFELNAFSDEYKAKIDSITPVIKDLGVTQGKTRYDSIIKDAQKEIDDAQVKLDEAQTKLNDAVIKYNDAQKEYIENASKLTSAKDDFYSSAQSAKDYYNNTLLQLNLNRPIMGETAYWYQLGILDAWKASTDDTLSSAWLDILDAESKLSDGKTKLDDAKKEIDDAQKEIDDNNVKVEDARQQLNDIPQPEWYVFSREDNMSFNSYKSNSGKVAAIAKVFPIFFFFVAALVSLTTMTRMVEEDRGQIGTLKALGYSKSQITSYYVWYSILATTLGGAAGCSIGFVTLPKIIANTYKMMYSTPATITVFWWKKAVLITLIAVACTTVATLWACLGQLSERPSTLMQPKAPKAGKRVLLERIGFIWNRMNFTNKVTTRNIFRYKKRFYMTVVGIAGCCALLLTGFGLRDSISDIVRLQFDEIYKFNVTTSLKNDYYTDKDSIQLDNVLTESPYVEYYVPLHSQTAYVITQNGKEKITFQVAKDPQSISSLYNLRIRRSGEKVPFNDDSFVLTEKLCETLNISVGDTVQVQNADNTVREVKVTGIVENYIMAYGFATESTYVKMYSSVPEYNLLLATLSDESHEVRDLLSKQVLSCDNVALLQFSQNIRESFSNTINKIYYIVAVLIICAAMLAVIVLYNLTNINICERKKELATIKVLGFHNKEVANYIFKEINILCLFGTFFGLLFGIALHSFVVRTAEVDSVMFGRTIAPLSYVISAGMTMVFSLIVNLLMLPKIKKINMVESMKANE